MNKAKSQDDAKLKAESHGCKTIVEYLNQKQSSYVACLKVKINNKEVEMKGLEERHASNMVNMWKIV